MVSIIVFKILRDSLRDDNVNIILTFLGPLKIKFEETYYCRDSIYKQLELYGVCEVEGVLNENEINKAIDQTWDTIEEMSPLIKRDDEKTWILPNLPCDRAGMIQSLCGWSKSQMFVREHVLKLYRLIYNTGELHSSSDGMTFSGIHRVRRLKPNKKVHFDQGEFYDKD